MPLTARSPRRRLLAVPLALAAAVGAMLTAGAPAATLAGPARLSAVSASDAAPARWVPGQRRYLGAPFAAHPAAVSAPVAAPLAANLTPQHAGSYTFMAQSAPGTPVAWNPCGVVHWTFSPANAPAGGLSAIQAAVSRISSATGLRFAYDGTVSTVPSGAYIQDQSAAAGFRPLLVGWTTSAASSLLANQPASTVGMNQTIWASPASGSPHIVSSVVALNAAVRAPTSGGNSWYTFALHELGHAVGLGHTSDGTQIMSPTIPAGATDYGSGDLAGLAKVGGSC